MRDGLSENPKQPPAQDLQIHGSTLSFVPRLDGDIVFEDDAPRADVELSPIMASGNPDGHWLDRCHLEMGWGQEELHLNGLLVIGRGDRSFFAPRDGL